MPIASTNQLLAAMTSARRVRMLKQAAFATSPYWAHSLLDVAGAPGPASSLSPGNVNGVVPVAGDPGYPRLFSFGGQEGYIARAEAFWSVTGRLMVFDRLWVGGAYTFNANQAVAMPSIAARVPDWRQVELWAETVTTITGTLVLNVGYTNQALASVTTGLQNMQQANGGPRRCVRIGLAAGDTEVRAVNSVVASSMTAGTFNLMLLRRLFTMRFDGFFGGSGSYTTRVLDALQLPLTRIYETSALYFMFVPDSSSSGYGDVDLDIVTG
jgi:hypothetical protein